MCFLLLVPLPPSLLPHLVFEFISGLHHLSLALQCIVAERLQAAILLLLSFHRKLAGPPLGQLSAPQASRPWGEPRPGARPKSLDLLIPVGRHFFDMAKLRGDLAVLVLVQRQPQVGLPRALAQPFVGARMQ